MPTARPPLDFDIPQFNGTVRVMAVAWTKDAVGHATTDVIVRDPIVVTASLPRFLAPGDKARAAPRYRQHRRSDWGLHLSVKYDGHRPAATFPEKAALTPASARR